MSAILQALPRRAYRELDVDCIDFSPLDLRTKVDKEDLDGLAGTMNDLGTLQPILVSLNSKTKRYICVIGGRRLRATKQNGSPTIPAFIMDDLSDHQALVIMLIENMQRDDLEPLEEACGMVELRDRFDWDEHIIAGTLGQRVQFVHDRLALLRLPEQIRNRVAENRLGVSQAVLLTHLEGMEKIQLAIAAEAEEKDLSVEVVAKMVDQVARPKRRYKKMERKHKLRKRGVNLSEMHTKKRIQQTVLHGERLLNMLDGFPLARWSPADAGKLVEAILAIEEGLQRFRRRAVQRSKEKIE